MPDKAPPNKTSDTCSGVGSNMPTDKSTCEALRSVSEKNYPRSTTDTQRHIRNISGVKSSKSSGDSGVL